jgi:hypothetical protein
LSGTLAIRNPIGVLDISIVRDEVGVAVDSIEIAVVIFVLISKIGILGYE